MSEENQIQSQEDLSTVLKVVSFCIPLVGLILWIVNKSKAPVKAKSAGKFALIGFAVGIVLNVVSMLMKG